LRRERLRPCPGAPGRQNPNLGDSCKVAIIANEELPGGDDHQVPFISRHGKPEANRLSHPKLLLRQKRSSFGGFAFSPSPLHGDDKPAGRQQGSSESDEPVERGKSPGDDYVKTAGMTFREKLPPRMERGEPLESEEPRCVALEEDLLFCSVNGQNVKVGPDEGEGDGGKTSAGAKIEQPRALGKVRDQRQGVEEVLDDYLPLPGDGGEVELPVPFPELQHKEQQAINVEFGKGNSQFRGPVKKEVMQRSAHPLPRPLSAREMIAIAAGVIPGIRDA